MKFFLLQVISILLLPLSCLWWLGQLFKHLPLLRSVDVIVIDSHMVNFGNGLVALDLSRYLFSGKKTAYALIWHPMGSQNPLIGLIYPDIFVVPLRRPYWDFRLMERNLSVPLKELLTPTLNFLSKIFFHFFAPQAEVRKRKYVWQNLSVPLELSDVIPENHAIIENEKWAGIYALALWAQMLKEPLVHPLSLPPHLSKNIHALLAKERGDKPAKLCMMYHRFDVDDPHHPRNGSPISEYLSSIHLLTECGYQVLWIGDRKLGVDNLNTFKGMAVDAEMLGVDENLFRLFAPTEADICIGDAGAGMLLPLIAHKRSLVLNSYPYTTSTPGTWVVPKRVFDTHGNEISFKRAYNLNPFGDYGPEDQQKIDMYPQENSEDEILGAIECFLEWVDGKDMDKPSEDDLLACLPKSSWVQIYGSRLSPSFTRRHSEYFKNIA